MDIDILRAALFTPLSHGRWGLPLVLWGPPGSAKTGIIEQVAEDCGLPIEVLSPGERGEGAFGVVPVPVDGVMTYPPPEWIRRFEGGRGLVFVDELSTAAPAIQAPLLGLMHARRVGGAILPPGVRVLGAANPTEQAAGGYDLAPPLANRLGHIDWDGPNNQEWADWLIGDQTSRVEVDAQLKKVSERQKTSAEKEEARVLKAWPEAFAKAAGLMAAFIRARPALHNKMPKADDPNASRAFSTARSQEFAVRALATGEVHGLTEVQTDRLFTAFVGAAFAVEFAVFKKEVDLPNPADILDGKKEFKHDPKRLDRTAAVLDACCALVTGQQAAERVKRSDRLWGILGDVRNDASDLVVPSVRNLIRANLHSSSPAIKVMAKINPTLKAARIEHGR